MTILRNVNDTFTILYDKYFFERSISRRKPWTFYGPHLICILFNTASCFFKNQKPPKFVNLPHILSSFYCKLVLRFFQESENLNNLYNCFTIYFTISQLVVLSFRQMFEIFCTFMLQLWPTFYLHSI